MILSFNDGPTLEIMTIDKHEEEENVLKISLKTKDYNAVRDIFSNSELTNTIMADNGDVYNNYSCLKRISTDMDGEQNIIMYIEMRYAGLDTIVEKMQDDTKELKLENQKLAEQVDMLTECILEMSELLYV